jgi:hypothetical protein
MWYHVNCLKLSVTKPVFELERKEFWRQDDCLNSDAPLLVSKTKIRTRNMGDVCGTQRNTNAGIQSFARRLRSRTTGELLVPFRLFGVLMPGRGLGYQRTCRTYPVHSAFGNTARSGMDPQEGIRVLILSGEVFDSGKNLFTSGPNWSGAGAFEVYLWAGRTLSIELELSGNEGLVGVQNQQSKLTRMIL